MSKLGNTYGAVYKCRLCGAEFIERETANKLEVYGFINDIVRDRERYGFVYGSGKSFHSCDDGGIGLADFQGWKKYDGEVM